MSNENLSEKISMSRRKFVQASAAVPALTGLAGNAVGYLAASDVIRVPDHRAPAVHGERKRLVQARFDLRRCRPGRVRS